MSLEMKHLSFGYTKKKTILKNISLEFPEKKFIAVLGPNGSGKTTLVKQINQILKPQSGNVFFDGVPVSSISVMEMAKKIAYVPQMTSGIMNGSVMDTVMLGRRPYIKWKPSDQDIQIVNQVLMRFHLEEIAQREFNQLSGGQKQTVLIARALAQTPEVYLFDEPVSFLDVKNQLEIMTAARELVDNDKKTVIMVVHDLNMALRFSDYVIIMKNGEVFAKGTPQEVLTEENIFHVYGTHASIYEKQYIMTSL